MQFPKILLPTLVAAAAMSVPAAAGTTVGDTTYSGTILTWTYNTGDMAYGTWYVTTYSTDDDGNGTYTLGDGYTTWSSTDSSVITVKSLIATTSSTADYNTLRFVSGTSSPTTFTFTPLAIAGIIVEENATGFSVAPGSSTASERTIYLGNATTTAAYSTINEDFTLSNALSTNTSTGFYIQGTQTWTIASGKTFTLAAANGFTVSGALTIDGAGTASFSGDDITSSATISIGSGATLDWSDSTVTSTGTITNSGTLDLSGATVSLSSAITNTGTVTVDSNTVFDLTSDLLESNSETTYVVISGGTVTNWTSLTLSNFTLDGDAIESRTTLDVSTAGTAVLTTTIADLVWAGTTSSSAWNTTEQNWTNNSSSDTFYSSDNVTFDSTAESTTVTVESEITAGTISVNSNYTFSIASGASVTGDSLTVASDSTLTLSGSGTLSTGTLATTGTVTVESGATLALTDEFGTTSTAASVSLENISGAGTVEVALAANYSNTLAVSTSFTGTTVVTSGYFSLTSSTTYGSTLELADGVNVQTTDTSGATFSGALVIDGTTQLHTNSGKSLTLDSSSSLTGDGTLNKQGAATLTVNGTVDIAAISVSAGTITFASNNAEIDALSFTSGGTVNFSLASGSTETTYKVDAISTTSSNNYTRYITIDDGVTVTATSLTNNWGLGSLTVNGTLDVETLTFSTGGNASTTTNVITGSGTISATTFYVGNVGTYNVNGGIRLELGSGGLAQNTASSATSQTVNLGKATLASTNDSWSSSLAITLADSDAGTTFEAAEDTTITLSGVLSGDGALNKTGVGTLSLSGTNTYTGDTTITEGTLLASAAAALGESAVTIDGGTLTIGSGITLEVSAITVVLSESLYTVVSDTTSSDSGVATSGLVSISDDTTTYAITAEDNTASLASGTTITLSVADDLVADTSVTYALTVFDSTISSLVDNGTVTVSISAENADTSGWEIAVATDGTVTLSYIPESSTFGVLAGTLALALAAARRRRRSR